MSSSLPNLNLLGIIYFIILYRAGNSNRSSLRRRDFSEYWLKIFWKISPPQWWLGVISSPALDHPYCMVIHVCLCNRCLLILYTETSDYIQADSSIYPENSSKTPHLSHLICCYLILIFPKLLRVSSKHAYVFLGMHMFVNGMQLWQI